MKQLTATLSMLCLALSATAADIVLGRWDAITWQQSGTNIIASWGASAAWSPLDLGAKLAGWFDAQATSTLTLSNDYVVAWADRSTNGLTASQSLLANRRTYIASDAAANNLPSLSSADNTMRYLALSASTSVTQMFFVAAYKDGADSSFDDYATLSLGSDIASQRVGMGSVGSANWYATSVLNVNGASINGASFSSTALPMPLSVVRFVLNAQISTAWCIGGGASAAPRGWRGPICEVILVRGTLDATEVGQIEAYLKAKWATP